MTGNAHEPITPGEIIQVEKDRHAAELEAITPLSA